MRLFVFFMIFGCGISYAGNTYSQTTVLSVNVKNKTVTEVFSEIEKNSEYIFFFYDEILDTERRVSINLKNQKIDVILDKLFENTNNDYLISDRQITISRKPNPTPELLLSNPVEEQQVITITGIVKDESGPLPGVTVLIKGTTQGAATDNNGRYTINVSGNESVLQFSYIGYITQEILVGNRRTIDVDLKENVDVLEEVVVIAYGVQKKESVVGAISQVKGTELVRGGTPTVGTALAGRVPGMVTIHQTGLPGDSDPVIYIRGVSSFSGNNQPLILVDGIERPLSDIDPSEVENISVLKDASATAVYGTKGGNGVILLTTKRGQEGRMEISVNVDATLKQSVNQKMQEGSYKTLSARNEYFRNMNMYDQVIVDDLLDRYRNPKDEWDKYIFPDVDAWEHGIRPYVWDSRASISARGGTRNAKYFLTLSYMHEGDLINSVQTLYDAQYRYDRVNYRMNFDFDLTKTTKLSVSSAGMVGKTQYGGSSGQGDGPLVVSSMYLDPPYLTPYVYPAKFVAQFPDPNYPVIEDRIGVNTLSPGKAVGWYRHNYNGSARSIRDRLGTDVVLTQKLDFITKGLNFRANFSYNNYANYSGGGVAYNKDQYLFQLTNDGYQWVRYMGLSVDMYGVVNPPYERNYSRGRPSYDYEYQMQMDYNRTFGDHTVSGLALLRRRIAQSGADFPTYFEQWSGRMTYDYQGKYMIEATLGVTGSERFSPANRFGYFPAAAVGWNMAREKFFQNLVPQQFSTLKVRYSYGETGTDNIGGFIYLSDFTNWQSYTLGYGTTSNVLTVREGQVPNSVARWERTVKHNLGFDLGFFNNSLFYSVEFFSENTDGILMSRNSIASWFGQGVKDLNLGKTKRHGYEMELRYQKYYTDWSWWSSANFNFYENRILERDAPLLTPDYQNSEGKPISSMSSAINIGYYQNMDEMINYSLNRTGIRVVGSDMVLDFNGDATTANDAVHQRYRDRPNITYALSGGVNYSQLELNFLIQGVTSVVRNWSGNYNPLFSRDPDNLFVMAKGRDDVWTPDNRNATHANWGGWSPANKAFVDASYFRLKTLELAYTFSKPSLKKIGFSSARVALQGYNLLTWAPGFILGDPENEATGRDGYIHSFYFYPIPRRYTLAIKFNF